MNSKTFKQKLKVNQIMAVLLTKGFKRLSKPILHTAVYKCAENMRNPEQNFIN